MSLERDDLANKSHSPRKILLVCREIMDGDAGIHGELDFAWQMSWILVLKLLDARERESKGRESIVPHPYRWRDWAVDPEGLKGKELIDFLEGEEVEFPDKHHGPGLFAALRGLQGTDGGDERDVIAQMFAAVSNRMVDGYLLRDVLGLVDRINFASPARARQVAALYEELLEGARDAWVGAGIVHTPRALVDLVVRVLRPRADEVLLDPACGDGGFLRAARNAMVGDPARTDQDVGAARAVRIEGSEPDPLAYVLGATNLLLHGVKLPAVYNEDPLAVRLSESGHDRSVDVILGTLPRGEVEAGVASAFPRDMQTSDATLLHLQLALRRLRQPGHGSSRGGRAALVVPDHVLSIEGAGSRIRARLLEEANLHTIVRLPPGVFEPASDVATSILFFDRGPPTRDIWYYAHPLPKHRRQVQDPRYTRWRKLQFEEFIPLLDWWDQRTENEVAWKVSVRDVLEYDNRGEVARCDLDRTRVVLTPAEPAGFAKLEEQEKLEPLEERAQREERGELDDLVSLPWVDVDPAEQKKLEPLGIFEEREKRKERGELEELDDLVSLPWVDVDPARASFAPPAVEVASAPKTHELAGSEAALRFTVPPVIDRPDLMGRGRQAASSALFLFTWVLWVFVWLPALTALAWYLGFLRFRDQAWDEGFRSLMSFLRFYGSVVGLATLLLLLWSLYNKWRFGHRHNRRRPSPPLEQEQVARDFGIEPQMLARIQSARIFVLDVSATGSILDARTRPAHRHHEPASEAWYAPAPKAEPEVPIAREPIQGDPLTQKPLEPRSVEHKPIMGGTDRWSASDVQRRDP